MHYAICYVSSASPNLTEYEIKRILSFSRDCNNENNITGILLYSDGNFFQVLEGNMEIVKSLFVNIRNNKNHQNILVIFEKEVSITQFDTYQSDFITLNSRFQSDIDLYFSQIEKLNPKIQSSVRYILNSFAKGIISI